MERAYLEEEAKNRVVPAVNPVRTDVPNNRPFSPIPWVHHAGSVVFSPVGRLRHRRSLVQDPAVVYHIPAIASNRVFTRRCPGLFNLAGLSARGTAFEELKAFRKAKRDIRQIRYRGFTVRTKSEFGMDRGDPNGISPLFYLLSSLFSALWAWTYVS